MPEPSELCQIDTAQGAGRIRRPAALYVPARILWNARHRGLPYTARVTLAACLRGIAARLGWRKKQEQRTPACAGEVLELQSGELVEVKPLEEIRSTLDGKGKRHGLTFTPEMAKHCGRRYRVFRRLEYMFDENSRTQRRVRHTVLLEGVFCTGEGIGCDRSCFLYWREAWLRRVEGGTEGREAAQGAAR